MNLGETIKDDEQFRLLASFFVSKASEPEEGYDPQFLEFYESALGAVVDESVETIIRMSGSPIERMFLGSLLLGSIKWFPYGIVVHQTQKHTHEELAEFREYLNNFFKFLEWYKNKNGSFIGLDDYLDTQVVSGKMESQEREYINRLIFRYQYLSLRDNWHMTLQPKFPDIIVKGKSIRPDILLWVPSDPSKKIIVECDGYQFHSEKNAFISDRARDRITSQIGYTTLRFSGTEIYRDTSGVATELLNYLEPDIDINEI